MSSITPVASTSSSTVPAVVGASIIVVVAVGMLAIKKKRQARMDNERVKTFDSPIDFPAESVIDEKDSA